MHLSGHGGGGVQCGAEEIDTVAGLDADGQRVHGRRQRCGDIEHVGSGCGFAGHALQPRTLDFHLGLHHGFVTGETIHIHHQLLAFERRDDFEFLCRCGGTGLDRLGNRGRRCAVILPTVAKSREGHGK
jgi:hypothetical protein